MAQAENYKDTVPKLREEFLEKKKDELDNYDTRDIERFKEDDEFAHCFLWSSKSCGDVDKAIELMDQVFKYRKEIKLNDLTLESFPEELREGKVFYYNGKDNKDQKIFYFKVVKNQKGKFVEEKKNYIAWNIEQHHKECVGKSKLCIVFDFTGAGVTNVDLDLVKHLLSCLTVYFPGTLDYMLLYEMPWLLSATWKIVQTWLTKEQKSVIHHCKKSDVKKYINEDQLEEHMK